MSTTTLEDVRDPARTRTGTYGMWDAGDVEIGYRPSANGRADPGEVVWVWVPYEDDPTQGKDRPALVLGTDGDHVLVLPMTSKDHDRDAVQEAREGRLWMDIGSGPWDARGRPSEVRLNRTVRIHAAEVRREGAALAVEVFDAVVAAWKAAQ